MRKANTNVHSRNRNIWEVGRYFYFWCGRGREHEVRLKDRDRGVKAGLELGGHYDLLCLFLVLSILLT